MHGIKLCLGVDAGFGKSTEEQIIMFSNAGFEAFFTGYTPEIKKYKKLSDEIGMCYQSVHAPFKNAAKMWQPTETAKPAIDELIACVQACATAEVPLLIVHPYIGFEDIENPTKAGIDNFGLIIDEAKRCGVRIAFENVEGESYLAALMNEFSACDHVGFCWDSGHEQCYNRGQDMLARYGKRLMATHLNDNLGISDFGGKIFWTDDLHLLPYDGIIDWAHATDRLRECGYDGILTFELTNASKPNRHDNDKYKRMPIEEYIAECYARACKVARMLVCK